MNVIPQSVRDGFLRAVGPIARSAIRAGLTPNIITTCGALVVLGSAVAYGLGEPHWGGALLLLSGLFDILDGQVARLGTQSSSFGAFYDSTLDRVGESAVFLGIALWFVHGGVPAAQLDVAIGVTIAALSASLLVSYTRARAEGLGFEAKVGIAQRAERFLVLGAPTLFFGGGANGQLLFWITVILAVTTAITVVQRVVHVARISHKPSVAPAPPSRKRDTLAGHPAVLRKGH
jgi:CDP-diacylglycerol---glycerol-3-phosphate 3-phosphatidyltransferase